MRNANTKIKKGVLCLQFAALSLYVSVCVCVCMECRSMRECALLLFSLMSRRRRCATSSSCCCCHC